MTCNICDGETHMGCCNPLISREAKTARAVESGGLIQTVPWRQEAVDRLDAMAGVGEAWPADQVISRTASPHWENHRQVIDSSVGAPTPLWDWINSKGSIRPGFRPASEDATLTPELEQAYKAYWGAQTPEEERAAYRDIIRLGGKDGYAAAEPAPFALTDQHVVALTRAIEAEGYRIEADPETGDVKLVAPKRTMETAPKDGTWVLLEGGRTGEGTDADDNRPVVARWGETVFGNAGWVFSFWDGAWRDEYEGPTHWSPVGAVKLENGA